MEVHIQRMATTGRWRWGASNGTDQKTGRSILGGGIWGRDRPDFATLAEAAAAAQEWIDTQPPWVKPVKFIALLDP